VLIEAYDDSTYLSYSESDFDGHFRLSKVPVEWDQVTLRITYPGSDDVMLVKVDHASSDLTIKIFAEGGVKFTRDQVEEFQRQMYLSGHSGGY
jgi:hypothetical protein